MRHVQGALTLFWAAMIPISFLTGWVRSVSYVSALSLWALVASHGAWWAAASVEARQLTETIPEDTVALVLDRTDLNESP